MQQPRHEAHTEGNTTTNSRQVAGQAKGKPIRRRRSTLQARSPCLGWTSSHEGRGGVKGFGYLEGDALGNGKLVKLSTLERLARRLLLVRDLCRRPVVKSRFRKPSCGHANDVARQNTDLRDCCCSRWQGGGGRKHSHSKGCALRLPIESGLDQSKRTDVGPISNWGVPSGGGR